jgi:hypothetical protein
MFPPHTLHVEDFEEFREFVRAWIDGRYELMVILGDGGLGKSETVERLASLAMGRANRKWAYIKGRMTPLKLYKTLYDFRTLPIVINDVDTLLKDETSISLLKCVCDTSRVKHVQWDSTHPIFKNLPTQFDSISRVLVIANSWDSLSRNVSALMNRGVVIHFQPTAIEVHREVGEGEWFDDQEVWEFVGKNLFLMTRPDLRFYIHARSHKQAGHDWKELTLRMLEAGLESGESSDKKEKLIYVARLLADPKYDELSAPESEREKVFSLAFAKGNSRSTFHRYKKKLLERRGTIDEAAVQQIRWRVAQPIATDFGERQEKLRAVLEQERSELVKAGGVGATDDDDLP